MLDFITPELARTFIICFTLIVVVVLFTIGAKKKWFSGFSLSKSGLSIEAKRVEKEFQSGNILQIMNESIVKCDYELVDYAVERASFLRKTLANDLTGHSICIGTCRAIVGVLRFPLYDAARRNNFKSLLKPEHILWYVERLMKEIEAEYEEFATVQSMAYCASNDEKKCPPIPDMKDIIPVIEKEVLENWALYIRRKVVEICNKKIEIYRQFAPTFQELGDTVKVKITEHCIDKNKNYIDGLVRKPDRDKKEL